MAFKLVKTDTVPRRITINVATDKPDVYRQESFVARFRLLPQSDLEAFSADDRRVSEVLDAQLVGLEEIIDENGNAVPFDVAKAALLDDTRAVTALWNALIEAQKGDRAKNSKK